LEFVDSVHLVKLLPAILDIIKQRDRRDEMLSPRRRQPQVGRGQVEMATEHASQTATLFPKMR
jgi:hypothetical protein